MNCAVPWGWVPQTQAYTPMSGWSRKWAWSSGPHVPVISVWSHDTMQTDYKVTMEITVCDMTSGCGLLWCHGDRDELEVLLEGTARFPSPHTFHLP